MPDVNVSLWYFVWRRDFVMKPSEIFFQLNIELFKILRVNIRHWGASSLGSESWHHHNDHQMNLWHVPQVTQHIVTRWHSPQDLWTRFRFLFWDSWRRFTKLREMMHNALNTEFVHRIVSWCDAWMWTIVLVTFPWILTDVWIFQPWLDPVALIVHPHLKISVSIS